MFDPFTTSYKLQPLDMRWLEIWDGLPIFVERSPSDFWCVNLVLVIQCYLYQNKLVVSFLLQFLEFHCKSHVSFHFDLTAHESFLWIEFTAHHIDKVLVLNYTVCKKYESTPLSSKKTFKTWWDVWNFDKHTLNLEISLLYLDSNLAVALALSSFKVFDWAGSVFQVN